MQLQAHLLNKSVKKKNKILLKNGRVSLILFQSFASISARRAKIKRGRRLKIVHQRRWISEIDFALPNLLSFNDSTFRNIDALTPGSHRVRVISRPFFCI